MKYKEIVSKVNAILKQYEYPLTLRQVYYRLVAAGIIDNTKSNYTSLSKILVKAREREEVDYRRIEDRVRSTIQDNYALPGPTDLYNMMSNNIEYVANKYRRDPWLVQDNYVEVWLEKDALSTVVSRIATNQYCVPVAVNRGFGSFSFIKEGAKRLYQASHEILEVDGQNISRKGGDKSPHILYFGDFDPSGEDMVRDLQRRIMLYGAPGVKVHKIALTKEQIKEWSLPPAPVKTSDTRANKFIEANGYNSAVELDALDPSDLQNIVKAAIEEYIDPDLWNASIDKSKEDREQIDNVVSTIKRCIAESTG